MELLAIYILWLREMKRFIRSKSRIIGNVSMPLIFLVVLGFGFGSAFTSSLIDVNYISFLAPGIIGMGLLFTSIFSGVSVIWDRQFGFLKEILVAPVSRMSIVVGKILGSSTIAMINGSLILLVAIILGVIPINVSFFVFFPLTFLVMLLICFCFVSLGLIIASRMNNFEGFQLIMSFIVMPLFFLSGAFFPVQNLPTWLKAIVFVDPLFYGVDALKFTLVGFSELPLMIDLAVLSGFTAAFMLIAAFLLRKLN